MKEKKTVQVLLQELRSMDDEKLSEQFLIVSRELLTLRLQFKTSHIKDNSLFGKYRKLKARIKTIIKEKSLVNLIGALK